MNDFFSNLLKSFGATNGGNNKQDRQREYRDQLAESVYGTSLGNIKPADSKYWQSRLGAWNGPGRANSMLKGRSFTYNAGDDGDEENIVNGILKYTTEGDKQYIDGIEFADGTRLGAQDSVNFLRDNAHRFVVNNSSNDDDKLFSKKSVNSGKDIFDSEGITPNDFFKSLRRIANNKGYTDDYNNNGGKFYHYEPGRGSGFGLWTKKRGD